MDNQTVCPNCHESDKGCVQYGCWKRTPQAKERNMSDKTEGIYRKFTVLRNDSSPKHQNCEYFVLDLTHDPYAMPAIKAYAEACKAEYPTLASDLTSVAQRGQP